MTDKEILAKVYEMVQEKGMKFKKVRDFIEQEWQTQDEASQSIINQQYTEGMGAVGCEKVPRQRDAKKFGKGWI